MLSSFIISIAEGVLTEKIMRGIRFNIHDVTHVTSVLKVLDVVSFGPLLAILDAN